MATTARQAFPPGGDATRSCLWSWLKWASERDRCSCLRKAWRKPEYWGQAKDPAPESCDAREVDAEAAIYLPQLSLYSCPLPQPSAACDDNPRTGRQSMVDQWICTRWTPPPPYQLFSAILKLKIKKRQLTVVICRRVSSAYRGTSTTYLTDEPPGPTKFSP